MRAPVSILVSSDTPEGFVRTLAALGEGLEAGLIREVVVLHAGPDPRLADIADAAGVAVAANHADALTRLGAPWRLYLPGDVELDAGWAALVLKHLRSGSQQPLLVPGCQAGRATMSVLTRVALSLPG